MKQIKTEYLVLAPMVPMVVHIYTFFAAYDHWLIAGAVAITFDLTIFMLFRFLRTKEVKTDRIAYRSVWIGIILMSLFQLYVNIRVYWSVQPGADAVAMGAIFPVMFGFLSFISARMELKVESYRKQLSPTKQQNSTILTAKNENNRETCESIFSQIKDKALALKAAADAEIPTSTAYRYWNEYQEKGSLL